MENRYSRQITYMGKYAQDRISKSKVCVVGCGALGSSSADLLVRAGVGTVKLVDRDFVELSNLQRQRVFSESDIDKPKATALAKKLKKINSSVNIDFLVEDLNSRTAENILKGCDLVIDGFDNMHSRFVLNEACVKLGIPWIYGSAIRNAGYASFIDTGENCLRCFIKNAPSEIETCETAGVTNAITSLISAIQVNETLHYLSDKIPSLSGRLFYADLEKMSVKTFAVKKNPECQVCSLKEFGLLNNRLSSFASLCGGNSYHISPPSKIKLDLQGAKMRLPKTFKITSSNKFLVRAVSGSKEITLFGDGRMITKNLEKSDAEKTFKRMVLV
ncbi:MAG: ThiF family adenylyltransferase [Candidatus Aenigmarchaeota archaeon]|nr:ThiF family adenylyltransferase [Candidatus Aenigmarchaeota archaeon]